MTTINIGKVVLVNGGWVTDPPSRSRRGHTFIGRVAGIYANTGTWVNWVDVRDEIRAVTMRVIVLTTDALEEPRPMEELAYEFEVAMKDAKRRRRSCRT